MREALFFIFGTVLGAGGTLLVFRRFHLLLFDELHELRDRFHAGDYHTYKSYQEPVNDSPLIMDDEAMVALEKKIMGRNGNGVIN